MMKTKRMIVNRITDWYNVVDIQSNPFYLSIIILEKLSTRKKMGIKYDRMAISYLVAKQRNFGMIEMIDEAIVILISRNLITINKEIGKRKTLIITERGLDALKKYKEVLNLNED